MSTEAGAIHRVSRADGVSEYDLLNEIIPNGLALGRGIFERMQRIDIEAELGDSLSGLIESRFKDYDFAVTIGKTPADPFGLAYASVHLIKRLVDEPIVELVAYVGEKAKKQFFDIRSLHAGSQSQRSP